MPTPPTPKPTHPRKPSLLSRVVALIEDARKKVAAVANIAQVYTNYEIGRQIVEEEQGGKRRADYGKKILIDLSQHLTTRFGRGWSVDSLERMRNFFLLYSTLEISATPLRESGGGEKSATPLRKSGAEATANPVCASPKFTLPWSHYILLMRIADPVERTFYEREATQGNWTFRQLERMYRASTFERLAVSKDKTKVRPLMTRPAPDAEVAGEALKDPLVTEFLGIPDRYDETELEDRIIAHLQDFMLEMGKGFTFHGRQVRCLIGDHSYWVDLAFYNRFTRSFFLIDLKLKKVGHGELGQMQTYINYFDRQIRLPDENPTVGILLTSEKVDQALVEMFTPDSAQNRIFVKQYTSVLPSKAALKRIVIEEKRKFEKEKLLALASSKSPQRSNGQTIKPSTPKTIKLPLAPTTKPPNHQTTKLPSP
jgi:predicted nuclease of restriction endonuclease-like (RecB) superfamily